MQKRGEEEVVDEFGTLAKTDSDGEKEIDESEVPWKRRDWDNRELERGS